ncbi:MAG TPA: hypothetical protein VGY66_17720 [Gemmataceae bacterium]|jgi:hypothetical protein|nr:hypothetical protein [Gemmataceae bacterium]
MPSPRNQGYNAGMRLPPKRLISLLLLFGLPLALPCAISVVGFGPVDEITETNAERIHPGMSNKEVEGILGTPADRVIQHESTGTIKGTITRRIWEGRDGAVHAVFVDGKTFRDGVFVLRVAPPQERNRGIGKFRIWIRHNIWRRLYG